MTDAEDEELLALDLEATERYRNRAKSVAGLVAAASGALAAGLVLNPSLLAYPWPIRVAITLSILFLLGATATFVVASVVSAKNSVDESRFASRLRKILFPWEKVVAPIEGDGDGNSEYRDRVHLVQGKIASTTSLAMWLSAIGIAFLATAIIGFVPASQSSRSVTMMVSSDAPITTLCPALPDAFQARVNTLEYQSDSSALALTVSQSVCLQKGRQGYVTVIVNRKDILAIGSRT